MDDFAQGYVDAWNRHDAHGVAAFYHQNGTMQTPITPSPINRPEIAQYVAALCEAFPDVRVEVVTYVHEGELHAAEWIMTGTHTGAFAGVPPTNRQIELLGCDFVEFQDGKISRLTMYYDRANLLSQLTKEQTSQS